MYRWWTIRAWRDRLNKEHGIKIGPLSILRYDWDGTQWNISVWNRWLLLDTGLRAHRI